MKLRPMPYPYRHPNSSEAADPAPETTQSVGTILARPLATDGQAERPEPRTDATCDAAGTHAIVMRVGIPLPIVRTVPLHVEMVGAGIPERVAALRLGARALDWWLVSPTVPLPVPTVEQLADRGLTLETTRTIDRTTFGAIERQLDPYGIHSARLMGRLLGHAVLTLWIENERTT